MEQIKLKTILLPVDNSRRKLFFKNEKFIADKIPSH